MVDTDDTQGFLGLSPFLKDGMGPFKFGNEFEDVGMALTHSCWYLYPAHRYSKSGLESSHQARYVLK